VKFVVNKIDRFSTKLQIKMSPLAEKLNHRHWTKDDYLISTEYTLIPVAGVNSMFESENVYWANPLPDEVMREMLEKSLCFGLFRTSSRLDTQEREFIGVYLTDVYILPAHQGGGLGKWLIQCVDEIVSEMQWLRRAMLFTSDWERSVPFYEKFLGMTVFGKIKKEDGAAVMVRKGKGLEGLAIARE